jgi:hypothetical protein
MVREQVTISGTTYHLSADYSLWVWEGRQRLVAHGAAALAILDQSPSPVAARWSGFIRGAVGTDRRRRESHERMQNVVMRRGS